jgi:YidC/Oxa1 family membrane protein insertase
METLFERIFGLLFSILNSYGLAILLISVLISLILMPFYHITSILENREKAIRLKLQPYILKINKIKDASIKHKCLSKLYRSYGYSPIKSLRSLSSLLIQIPFFIVAYRVLSKLLVDNPYKANLSFLFINNLGTQDALLGGVNLLPVLMTYINIISVMLMTPFKKERKQSYVIAVFFLVLLYMSPAGLVLYWTSNNFINLLRYLFIYLKEKNFRSVKYKLINYFSSIFRNEGSRVFIFLVSMYFVINLMPRSRHIVFHTFIAIPLIATFCLRIYDYIKININSANPNIRNIIKEKKQFLIKLSLVILCFIVLFFVKKKGGGVYWLCDGLILLAIYNYKSIKFNKIKNVFKSIALPMSAMLFPALLYVNSNPFFFKCIDC